MLGKQDVLDRTVQFLVALVALFSLVFGSWMLWDPYGWYQSVPTVRYTGPPNLHFIRDIGLAYLASAVILGYAALRPRKRWRAAAAGNIWLSAHGLLHIWEVANGICAPDRFWADAPGVLGPPMIVWAAVATLLVRRRELPTPLPQD